MQRLFLFQKRALIPSFPVLAAAPFQILFVPTGKWPGFVNPTGEFFCLSTAGATGDGSPGGKTGTRMNLQSRSAVTGTESRRNSRERQVSRLPQRRDSFLEF